MDEPAVAAIEAFERDRALSCWRALADGYRVIFEARVIQPITADRDVVAAISDDRFWRPRNTYGHSRGDNAAVQLLDGATGSGD